MVKRLTTEEFINKAMLIHGDKYNYSKFIYTDAHKDGEIICNTCKKNFPQRPNNHLNGAGCPRCSNCERLTTKEFIAKSIIVHGDKFDYSNTIFISSALKVEIKCRSCQGTFNQWPQDHLRGCGCVICKKLKPKTTKQFINEAVEAHDDKYDYSEFIYVNIRTSGKIICHKKKRSGVIHGAFQQNPDNHLNGAGCPKCSHTISKNESFWLDYINVDESLRNKTLKINNRKFNVDALDEKNKIIYEFNGDYWHGNPNRFNPNDMNKVVKKTFGELYQKTIDKQKYLEANGYTVISIWESQWKQLKKVLEL